MQHSHLTQDIKCKCKHTMVGSQAHILRLVMTLKLINKRIEQTHDLGNDFYN